MHILRLRSWEALKNYKLVHNKKHIIFVWAGHTMEFISLLN